MSPWQPAMVCSRAGAAHLRRGRGSQDWTASTALQSADGQPLQLMAVADGHGGSRYLRSATGSRLACESALAEAGAALAAARLEGTAEPQERWQQWLAQELPRRIQASWLEAIRRDWDSHPGADDDGTEASGFSPLLYGTTLALVVLTPRWWGHTGLGDWDLVRVEADGRAQLLSEETPGPDAPGEATASLCLPEAAALCAPRAALHRLDGEMGRFGLLLSTDGIRKSCATDADFLALASHLVSEESRGQLEPLLDRISREGSGDDVSLASVHWEPPDEADAAPTDATPADATPQGHRRGLPPLLLLGAVSLLLAVAAGALALRRPPPPTVAGAPPPPPRAPPPPPPRRPP
ncbi:MAG: protein phosphatase 2C domain-containing protein, partial [Prochlorococcaceae cyanobacterium]